MAERITKRGVIKTIKIDKLLDNPFRNLKAYPLQEGRLAKLRGSMKGLGDFGILACRKEKEHYELAFGHHRRKILTDLGETEMAVKIFDYTDVEMYLAMVNENREFSDIFTRLNDVEQGRKIITDIRTSCKNLKEWRKKSSNLNLSYLKSDEIDTEQKFKQWKGKTVGATYILALLNKDKQTWTQSDVELALKIIDNDIDYKVDKEAVLLFPNQYQMSQFITVIEKIMNGKSGILDTENDVYELDYHKHKEIAEKTIEILEKNNKGGRDISEIVMTIVEDLAAEETDKQKAIKLVKHIAKTCDELMNDWRKLLFIREKPDVVKFKYLYKAAKKTKELRVFLEGNIKYEKQPKSKS